jgi:hypothetical protein
MDDRATRIGKNEALFREVNERIEQISDGTPVEFLCECGDPECTLPVRLDLPAFEEPRASSDHFAVIPGHEEPNVEEVVEYHDGYFVVRKHAGGSADLAAATDPRA